MTSDGQQSDLPSGDALLRVKIKDKVAATQSETIRRQLPLLGFYFSAAYLIFLATMAGFAWDQLFAMDPNEFGDLLAGCFAPLAFLWLVLGFFQQGQELQASVRALELQGKELQNSVEQQRELVRVSREHMESEMATNRQTLENFKSAERGSLTATVSTGHRLTSGLISVKCHVKNHGKNKVKVIAASGMWQEAYEKTDKLPTHISAPIWVSADGQNTVSFPIASDDDRQGKKELIGRITYEDQFGDRHFCWVAAILAGLREPDELERITGGNWTHEFSDMSSSLDED